MNMQPASAKQPKQLDRQKLYEKQQTMAAYFIRGGGKSPHGAWDAVQRRNANFFFRFIDSTEDLLSPIAKESRKRTSAVVLGRMEEANSESKAFTFDERIDALKRAISAYTEAHTDTNVKRCRGTMSRMLRQKAEQEAAAKAAKEGENGKEQETPEGNMPKPVVETPAPVLHGDIQPLKVPGLSQAAEAPVVQPSTDGVAPVDPLRIPTPQEQQLASAQRAEESGNRALRPAAALKQYTAAATLYGKLDMTEDAERCRGKAEHAQKTMDEEAAEAATGAKKADAPKPK